MLTISRLEDQLAETENDLTKIDLMNEIAFKLHNYDPSRSLGYLQQIDDLLMHHPGYLRGKLMLRLNQKLSTQFRSFDPASLSELVEIVDTCRKEGETLYLVRALTHIGETSTFNGNQATGLEKLLEALSLAEAHGYKFEQVAILQDLGISYGITEIPERMDQALKAFQQALTLATEIDNRYGIALVLNNLAALHYRMGDYSAALKYAQQCLLMAQQDQNHVISLMALVHLADLYAREDEKEKAIEALTQCEPLIDQLENKSEALLPICEYYYFAGNTYLKWRDLDRSEELLLKSLQLAHEGLIKHTEIRCRELLVTLYEEMGNLTLALENHRQFHKLKEEVFREESDNKFQTLSVSYQLKQAQTEAEHQKTLQEEGQRHIQRLQMVNNELESFSYSVSHDLRAPLRSITGFSQILLEDYHDQLDPEGQGYLHKVINASKRMEHLIDDLLKLSRITRSDLVITTVCLSKIAADIAKQLAETVPERKIDWTIIPGINVEGDPSLLRVVLENLLNNAWKYSSKQALAIIEFGCRTEGQEYICYVRDNGAGFDMNYKDKLFKVFQRLHRVEEFEGTGVGLATVYRIITRHGGRIWAEGKVNEGATFFFTLPAGIKSGVHTNLQ